MIAEDVIINLFLFIILMISIIILIMLIIKNHKNKLITESRQIFVLGTIIQLKIYGKKKSKALDDAIKDLNEIDDKMSVFKEDSEISKINKNAGKEYQKVSYDTYHVIKKAVEYSDLSEGAFDLTIRPLVNLWKIGTYAARIPEQNEIEDAIKLVNYKDVILNETNASVKLEKENQCIDVGAIAKGYAADKVKKILVKNKIKSAVIDLGGNIVVIGKKNNGKMWNIGIQDPLTYQGDYIGIINVKNKSVVTSGNYERYSELDGKVYHHTINSKTGYPYENGIISVTIISDYSVDGDALATCVYGMGIEKGIELIKKIKGVGVIIIDKNKNVYITPNIKEKFKLIKNEFEILVK